MSLCGGRQSRTDEIVFKLSPGARNSTMFCDSATPRVNTRSKVHQRDEVKIHQLQGVDGLMVLLLAGGAQGDRPLAAAAKS